MAPVAGTTAGALSATTAQQVAAVLATARAQTVRICAGGAVEPTASSSRTATRLWGTLLRAPSPGHAAAARALDARAEGLDRRAADLDAVAERLRERGDALAALAASIVGPAVGASAPRRRGIRGWLSARRRTARAARAGVAVGVVRAGRTPPG